MPRRFALITLLGCSILPAGTDPKATAAEYPAHASLPEVSIGAEYLVRSVSGRGRTFFLNEYLIVEVGVFPTRGQRIELSDSQFTLRIGSKREILYPASAGFVAASLKYPDWDRRRTLEATAGGGGGDIIFGRPQPVERFPGDPRPGQSRLPEPPRVPDAASGVEREEPVRVDELVKDAALPEGEAFGAISGYLYFPFKGKTKSLRPLELIYRGPTGTLTIRLP